MIDGWSPDHIATTGDNVYSGIAAAETGTDRYDRAVGRLFCEYLRGAAPGPRCPTGGTAPVNRFFAATGNHDYTDGGPNNTIGNYTDYFDLPGPGTTSTAPSGSELHYDVVLGPVHLFVIDSEAALRSSASLQQQKDWLEEAVSDSTAPWQVVAMHDPPYSSGAQYGSATQFQWPYANWGADLVLGGHAHLYERVMRNGIPYVTIGLGGDREAAFASPIAGSEARYNAEEAAVRIDATGTSLTLDAINISGTTVDSYDWPTLDPVDVTTASLPGATRGTPYNQSLQATGGTPPYTWTRTAGSLPAGLILSAAGTISGTPTASGTSTFTAQVTDANGNTAAATLSVIVTAPAENTGGAFVGGTPSRLLDTRQPGQTPCLSGAAGRALTVAGVAGVPANAAAVALNVTVVGPRSPGYLTVYPAGVSRPTASNINYTAGQTVPNLVTSKVGTGGQIVAYASGGCPNVVVDITGYYSGGTTGAGGFVPLSPRRLNPTSAPCVSGPGRALIVGPSSGVPADAAAVALNVTAVGATAPGYITVYPDGQSRPTSSNLNYTAGQTVANHATVVVGTGGRIQLYASGGCPRIVVDVAGYYTGGTPGTGGFVGIRPTRTLDTRSTPPCVNGTRDVTVTPSAGVPADAGSVVLNVTVTRPTVSGHLTVFPTGAPRPTSSNLNFSANQTVPNAVITKVGAGGKITLNAPRGCPHVVIDVLGYHVGAFPR